MHDHGCSHTASSGRHASVAVKTPSSVLDTLSVEPRYPDLRTLLPSVATSCSSQAVDGPIGCFVCGDAEFVSACVRALSKALDTESGGDSISFHGLDL